jgi:hypothetical protein
MGGSNDESNMTRLTCKEHYLAHRLLTKMYRGHSGLYHAFAMMAVGTERTYTSGQYNSMKEARSIAMKKDNPMHKKENRDAQAVRAKALWESNNPMWRTEVKELHSDRMKKHNPNQGGATNHTARPVEVVWNDGTVERFEYMLLITEKRGVPYSSLKLAKRKGLPMKKYKIAGIRNAKEEDEE